MAATITIPIDRITSERLIELSKYQACSQSELAERALSEYLDLHLWQIQAINEGIEAADQGRLIEHHDLRSRWESRLGNQVD